MSKPMSYPPFTKEEFAREVREHLYIQASQIAHACSDDAAAAFLGFPSEFSAAGSIDHDAFSRIDLSRFPAWNYLSVAYDYAFQVGNSWHYNEDVHTDVVALSNGMSIAAISGEDSPYMNPNSMCRNVIDRAIGRFYLEEWQQQTLTVRQLALLADMSEAAVRNSLSAEKIKTPVESEIARIWMRARKAFVPTKSEEHREAFWKVHTRSHLNASRFSDGLATVIGEMGLTNEEIARRAGVPQATVRMLLDGPSGLPDLSEMRQLGEALNLDVPHFVGQATEAALRKQG